MFRASRSVSVAGENAGAARRPLWSVGLALFCAATVLFLAWRDVFVPEARDVEVWFGFELRGGAALATAPLHWALYGFGAWSYWTQKRWVWPWASVYAFAIAISHGIWNFTSENGGGSADAAWQVAFFSLPALALLAARFPPHGADAS